MRKSVNMTWDQHAIRASRPIGNLSQYVESLFLQHLRALRTALLVLKSAGADRPALRAVVAAMERRDNPADRVRERVIAETHATGAVWETFAAVLGEGNHDGHLKTLALEVENRGGDLLGTMIDELI